MRTGPVVTALTLLCSPAYPAEDETSATFWLPHCKGFLTNSTTTIMQGYCAGLVMGMAYVLNNLTASDRLCADLPKGVKAPQAVRVVIRYIELHPEKMHLPFTDEATLALINAWPCK